MSFRQWLNEFSIIKVQTSPWYGDKEVVVVKNLTHYELFQKLQKIEAIRGIKFNNEYYWWDANLANHDAIIDKIGKTGDTYIAFKDTNNSPNENKDELNIIWAWGKRPDIFKKKKTFQKI